MDIVGNGYGMCLTMMMIFRLKKFHRAEAQVV
nr:MAG TPA: hypothetical protein [Bacteriophage sp.]